MNRLLSVAVFVAVIGVLSADAWIFTRDKILYESVDDNTVKVTGCDKTLVDAVIPSTVVYDNTTYNVVSIAASAFSNNSTLETLTAPESVVEVGENAFFLAKKLREVKLPGVTSLGVGAFYLSTVEKVVFGKNLTALPKDAFSSCKSKLEVDLSNIRSIGRTAFRKCTMDKVVISDGTTLDVGAFQESNIGSMTITGNINLPETSTVFDNAKVDNLKLIDVNFAGFDLAVMPTVNKLEIYQQNSASMNIGRSPAKSKAIYIDADTEMLLPNPSSSSPFGNCSLLEEVTFGSLAKVIFKAMFYNCPKLKTVRMSSSTIEVRSSAFSNCNGLSVVECASVEPPVCAPDAFTATAYSNATLKVPDSGKEAYAAADGWSKFAKIEGGLSGIDDVTIKPADCVRVAGGRIMFDCPEDTRVAVYAVDGRLIYAGAARDIEPGSGFFIVHVGKRSIRVVIR